MSNAAFRMLGWFAAAGIVGLGLIALLVGLVFVTPMLDGVNCTSGEAAIRAECPSVTCPDILGVGRHEGRSHGQHECQTDLATRGTDPFQDGFGPAHLRH
jgi:hypothetical protein